MSGRRIYLVASTGYPNYGDELIAGQWLRFLAATEPDAEVWLDCPNPGGAALLMSDLHPNVRFTDTLFRVAWAAPSEEPGEVAEFGRKAAVTPGFGVPHRAAGVELLEGVDVVHVLGGSYVNAIWPRHLALLAAGAALAERGRRVAATGLGLVPAAADADLLASLVHGYAAVDVRDNASAGLLAGAELASGTVSRTGDDALLDLGPAVYDDRDTPSTMMCFQSDLVEGGVEALATSARETAKAWGLRGDKVGYVEAIPGQDRVVFEMIEADLPGIRFYPFTEVWRAGLPARRGQRWLTTRPDLHLAAAAVGAWGVAFPVRPGYDDATHRTLVDQGSRWAIGTPGEVAPQAHGEAGFGTAVQGMVEAKKDLARRLYAR